MDQTLISRLDQDQSEAQHKTPTHWLPSDFANAAAAAKDRQLTDRATCIVPQALLAANRTNAKVHSGKGDSFSKLKLISLHHNDSRNLATSGMDWMQRTTHELWVSDPDAGHAVSEDTTFKLPFASTLVP